jgi:hypothetical protein
MKDMLHGKGAEMLDYDAICTFMFKDYKDLARFMYDPGSKALTPDHENCKCCCGLGRAVVLRAVANDFLHSVVMVEEEMKMMVGDEYMVIDDGKRVG